MHLYTYDPAPNPKRVGYVIQYKGIEIPTTQIDLTKKEQFSETFKAINAGCTVPTLTMDDGRTLCSTIAIAKYIDSRFPEKPLFGRDIEEEAEIIDWVNRLHADGFNPIGEILRNGSKAFKDRPLPGQVPLAQIPELVERGHIRINEFWRTMNTHLANRDYVVGDQPSMADIDLASICDFYEWIALFFKDETFEIPAEHEHLNSWRHRFMEVLGGASR